MYVYDDLLMDFSYIFSGKNWIWQIVRSQDALRLRFWVVDGQPFLINCISYHESTEKSLFDIIV
jgi:hypothetical protein